MEVDCSTVTRIKPSLRLPVRAALSAGALLLAAGSFLAAQADDKPLFVERAAQWGIDFVHTNGMSGKFYYPEIMGGGGGLVDYDGDGDLDVYLVQGGRLRPDGAGEPGGADAGSQASRDRLFRNDAVPGSPDGSAPFTPRFVDVTDAAGLAGPPTTAWGSPPGDVDGDGWTDLYVTDFGPNQLWRNRGDGTFEDVTAAAGAGRPALERRGDLLRLRPRRLASTSSSATTSTSTCRQPRSASPPPARRDYCGPPTYQPQPDRLFHNRGDGTFEDVTGRAGHRSARPAPALGVVAADFDGDGWLDLYVANDGTANHLWHQPRRRHLRGRGAARRRARVNARRASPRRAWGSTPATSTATATRTSS